MSGTIDGTIALGGCTGNTGGGSMPFWAPNFGTGGKIPWINGQSTTVTISGSQVETDGTEANVCPTETTEFESSGKVTADTTGSAIIGGKVKSEDCVNFSNNAISNEPGTKFKIK